jgi:hypothetical protein
LPWRRGLFIHILDRGYRLRWKWRGSFFYAALQRLRWKRRLRGSQRYRTFLGRKLLVVAVPV